MSFPPTTLSYSKQNIGRLFDAIAPRYDFLNRLLSLRQDVRWRRALIPRLPKSQNMHVLDLATGTADIPLALAGLASIEKITGLDISPEMVALGQRKVMRAGLGEKITLARGNAMNTGLPAGSFHAVTMGFGIRNVTHPSAALGEILRLLKPGGRALILEFSLPRHPLIRLVYLFYFRHILPVLGGFLSGKSYAYRYLNRTVETFPHGRAFEKLMLQAGFHSVCSSPLSFGIASIYTGEKADAQKKLPTP